MRTFGVGVSYGSVTRSDNTTALKRSRYQRSTSDRKKGCSHLRGWLLVPETAPDWSHDASNLWKRAGDAEIRCDAIEGMFLDISWPRSMPLELADEVVRQIYGPLITKGLAVQVDLERKRARDGGDNDHLHALISVRQIDEAGFAKRKARWLTNLFHSQGGRWARSLVASVFSDVAKSAGLDIEFDPRSNAERGLPVPEDRLPRSFVRRDTAASRDMLERLDRQREIATAFQAASTTEQTISDEIAELNAEFDALVQSLIVLRPTAADANADQLDHATAATLQAHLPGAAGPVAEIAGRGTVFPVASGAVVDAGTSLRCEPAISSDVAVAITRLCQEKGWQRIEIDHRSRGAAASTDWYRMPPTVDVDHRVPSNTRWAAERIADLLADPDTDRAALLAQLSIAAENDESAGMIELIERLSIAGLTDIVPPEAPDITAMTSTVQETDGASAWQRWCREMDLALADLPGTALGSILRPGRRIPIPRGPLDPDLLDELTAAAG